MKASFNKYPIDIVLCMLLSIVLLPVVLLDLDGTIRIILGLPFILFIPGYILIFTLFPAKKTDSGIDVIERVALSFGLSIAVVPLIGLLLNYTPWGIRLEPVLFSIFIFIMGVGIVAIYRWFSLKPKNRFIVSVNLSFPKSEGRLDKALTIILVASILIALATLVYVIVIPKQGEQFTEFYLLGPDGMADDYPSHLGLGEYANGIFGIVNHEYQTINYTVEVWLIDQSVVYNETNDENETVYSHMWFVDKIKITLDHYPLNIEEAWTAQWEENFSLHMNRTGLFKLAFLLFREETDEYVFFNDYQEIAEEKLNNAYRELHLWIEVAFSRFYLLDSDGFEETYYRNLTLGENATGIIGIANNEFKTINYTVEVWLVNESTIYDETLQENVTTIHNMWFMDSITVMLNHTDALTQWEQNYSLTIDKTGSFRLAFLLFSTPTEGYIVGEDYLERAEIIFDDAEQELSIWVNVT